MIRLRACPRCKGDLIEESDWNGAELVCIQCAYRAPLGGSAEQRRPRERSSSATRRREGAGV